MSNVPITRTSYPRSNLFDQASSISDGLTVGPSCHIFGVGKTAVVSLNNPGGATVVTEQRRVSNNNAWSVIGATASTNIVHRMVLSEVMEYRWVVTAAGSVPVTLTLRNAVATSLNDDVEQDVNNIPYSDGFPSASNNTGTGGVPGGPFNETGVIFEWSPERAATGFWTAPENIAMGANGQPYILNPDTGAGAPGNPNASPTGATNDWLPVFSFATHELAPAAFTPPLANQEAPSIAEINARLPSLGAASGDLVRYTSPFKQLITYQVDNSGTAKLVSKDQLGVAVIQNNNEEAAPGLGFYIVPDQMDAFSAPAIAPAVTPTASRRLRIPNGSVEGEKITITVKPTPTDMPAYLLGNIEGGTNSFQFASEQTTEYFWQDGTWNKHPSETGAVNATKKTIIRTDNITASFGQCYYVIPPVTLGGFVGPEGLNGITPPVARRVTLPPNPTDGCFVEFTVWDTPTDYPLYLMGNVENEPQGIYQRSEHQRVLYVWYNNTWNPHYNSDGSNTSTGGGDVTTAQLNAVAAVGTANAALIAALEDGNSTPINFTGNAPAVDVIPPEVAALPATDSEEADRATGLGDDFTVYYLHDGTNWTEDFRRPRLQITPAGTFADGPVSRPAGAFPIRPLSSEVADHFPDVGDISQNEVFQNLATGITGTKNSANILAPTTDKWGAGFQPFYEVTAQAGETVIAMMDVLKNGRYRVAKFNATRSKSEADLGSVYDPSVPATLADQGTGTGEGVWEFSDEQYNPINFGASLDNVSDDTPSIMACLQAAHDAKAEFDLQSKSYLVSPMVWTNRNCSKQGRWNGAIFTPIEAHSGPLLKIENINDQSRDSAEFTGTLTINGSRLSENAFEMHGGRSNTFKLSVNSCEGHGAIFTCEAGFGIYKNRITVQSTDNKGDGIVEHSPDSGYRSAANKFDFESVRNEGHNLSIDYAQNTYDLRVERGAKSGVFIDNTRSAAFNCYSETNGEFDNVRTDDEIPDTPNGTESISFELTDNALGVKIYSGRVIDEVIWPGIENGAAPPVGFVQMSTTHDIVTERNWTHHNDFTLTGSLAGTYSSSAQSVDVSSSILVATRTELGVSAVYKAMARVSGSTQIVEALIMTNGAGGPVTIQKTLEIPEVALDDLPQIDFDLDSNNDLFIKNNHTASRNVLWNLIKISG